jgi:hypothetical protein
VRCCLSEPNLPPFPLLLPLRTQAVIQGCGYQPARPPSVPPFRAAAGLLSRALASPRPLPTLPSGHSLRASAFLAHDQYTCLTPLYPPTLLAHAQYTCLAPLHTLHFLLPPGIYTCPILVPRCYPLHGAHLVSILPHVKLRSASASPRYLSNYSCCCSPLTGTHLGSGCSVVGPGGGVRAGGRHCGERPHCKGGWGVCWCA